MTLSTQTFSTNNINSNSASYMAFSSSISSSDNSDNSGKLSSNAISHTSSVPSPKCKETVSENWLQQKRVGNFQSRISRSKHNSGWVCNISAGYKFSSSDSHQIQLSYKKLLCPLLNKPSVDYREMTNLIIAKQFEYICKLLIAGNCKTIYFDAAFSNVQFETIRKLQIHSGTELLNARLMYMFTQVRHA